MDGPGAGADQPGRRPLEQWPAWRTDLRGRAEHWRGVTHRIDDNCAALEALRIIDSESSPQYRQDHMRVLAGWSGWGGLGEVFSSDAEPMARRRAYLRELLDEEAYAAARAGVLSEHYTHPAYAQAIWVALEGAGVVSGQVLEPGCGIGTFIGLAPTGVRMTGVEVDPTTARITSLLYPEATIRPEGYETTPTTDYFDAVVGNVPFAAVTLHDPIHNPGGHRIHNHFILKALAQTKPGGYVALITSHHTLDALNPGARREMQARADLIAAVRLPTGAHEITANTQALTDVLVLRVRKDGEEPAPFDWEHTARLDLGGDQPIAVNQIMTPGSRGRVLGAMSARVGMYGALGLVADGETDPAAIAQGLQDSLEAQLGQAATAGRGYAPTSGAELTPPAPLVGQEAHIPQGTIRRHDGAFERLGPGGFESIKVPSTQVAELTALLDLRDQTRTLLEAEAATREDTPALSALRTRLDKAYQAYTTRYGALNRATITTHTRADGTERTTRRLPPAIRLFSSDPHAPLTRAIEVYDETTGLAQGAPILTSRQLLATYTPQGADTAADAIAISLDQKGTVDLDYCAHLLGSSPADARAQMGALVFDDPTTGALMTAEDYLSGNVRSRLTAARAALEAGDQSYRANVQALEEVLPPDLGIADITPSIGAPWIAPGDYTDFLTHLVGGRIQVSYNPHDGWGVQGGTWGTQATSVWGTHRLPAGPLLQKILNNQPIEVRIEGTINLEATEEAKGHAQEMEEAFDNWIWQDPQRTRRLLGEYNQRFNSLVQRSYEEAGKRLTLPGLADSLTLRPHQRSAVARMIAEPTAGLFHEVGAGKTLEMVCGVMEQKRLGLIRKPMIVVPNHMLEQFQREWLQAYPAARILAADRESLGSRDKRTAFMARVTTSDWDAVICTQSAFKAIGVSHQTVTHYEARRLAQLDAWIENGADAYSVRRVEQARANLANKLRHEEDKRAAKADPGLTFEQLGVDYLVIDEAHHYKNLSAPTNTRGILATTSSAMAKDLEMKLDYLRRTHGPRVLTMATATPIANTMGEMWVMTHYLRPDLLQDAGLETFDAWAHTFTSVATNVEANVAGALKVTQRISQFRNMPELQAMFSTFADVKRASDLDLDTPDLATGPDGKPGARVITIDVGAPMNQAAQIFLQRAQAVTNRTVPPHQDNFLAISADGRALANDYRLLGDNGRARMGHGLLQAFDGTHQKVDAVADKITEVWQRTRHNTYLDHTGSPAPTPGGLQLVFCDEGTPKSAWNLYDELSTLLEQRGIPADQIAYTHQARNSREKDQLFAKARTGAISVLIGSTSQMGTGANIQARAVALHHVTAPWRPCDITQREGRIIRQGNQNPTVEIYRYVTAGSFDTFLWQTLERKAAFIDSVLTGTATRDMQAVDLASAQAADFAQVKALASGNPLAMEEARLANEVTSLTRRSRGHQRQQRYLTAQGPLLARQADNLNARAARREELASRATDTFTMTIAERTHDERATALADLCSRMEPLMASSRERFSPPSYAQARYAYDQHLPISVQGIGMTLGRLGPLPQDRAEQRWVLTITDLLSEPESHGQGVSFTSQDITERNPGLIRRLTNHIQRLSADADRLRSQAADTLKEAEHVAASLGAPDPWADKLAAANAQLTSIRAQIRAAQAGQDTLDHMAGPAGLTPHARTTQSGTSTESPDQELTRAPFQAATTAAPDLERIRRIYSTTMTPPQAATSAPRTAQDTTPPGATHRHNHSKHVPTDRRTL